MVSAAPVDSGVVKIQLGFYYVHPVHLNIQGQNVAIMHLGTFDLPISLGQVLVYAIFYFCYLVLQKLVLE